LPPHSAPVQAAIIVGDAIGASPHIMSVNGPSTISTSCYATSKWKPGTPTYVPRTFTSRRENFDRRAAYIDVAFVAGG
jgi:hypothetical protein